MSDAIANPTPDGNAHPQAEALNTKILEHLGDRVILKPLTRWNEAYKEFPRYVMEYLVSRYVDAEEPVAGQRKIDRILPQHVQPLLCGLWWESHTRDALLQQSHAQAGGYR